MPLPSHSSSGRDRPRSDIAAQINKRLTLNLLIQGAAAHMFVTASHLVQDELEQIRPGLTRLYDRFAISGQLNYCIGDNALVFGRPNRRWGFSRTPQEPFRDHLLMATYGNRLAIEETRHLRKLGKPKRVIGLPVLHWCQFMVLVCKVLWIERGHSLRLTQLAIQVASEIWGIPRDRLDGTITRAVAFGNLQPATSFQANVVRNGAAGYGGVERRGDRFVVVAKAWVFPLLIHELVKGITELICLHGLGELEDDVYQAVIDAADRVEYEAWLLQAGPAMWRRFIAVVPRDRPLAQTMMNVAKLDPEPLEKLMMQIMEKPSLAARMLSGLG
jgi:hypothetical protein